MTSILLHVEPEEAERDQMVGWAADLVEFITGAVDETNGSSLATIGVVASLADCLEIGSVMLGRGAARTVEGGERNPSPLSLLPFLEPEAGEGSATNEIWACLLELAEAGAVEGISEDRQEELRLLRADQALGLALERTRWDDVVVLGESNASADRLSSWERNNGGRVIRPTLDDELRGRFIGMLREIQQEADEALREIQHGAVQAALQLERLIIQLGRTPGDDSLPFRARGLRR